MPVKAATPFLETGRLRVLILGGYGAFGSRLARILDREAAVEIIIAGRDVEKARAFIASLKGPAGKTAVSIDINHGFEATLQALSPSLVVHCAGPFQGQDYRVARICLEAGAHYVDLADARAFVSGFSSLDGFAKEKGLFALSGASTTPALSFAVVKELASNFSKVTTISVGVTPGNRAPRGLAVVKGILSYIGEPVPVLREGTLKEVTGWGDLNCVTIDDLGVRWFSPVDTPDVMFVKSLFPDLQRFDFYAGLELRVFHFALWGLAKLRAVKLIPNIAAASGAFRSIASFFERAGTDRGGMFVRMNGEGLNSEPLQAQWSLVAGAGDGPFIPTTAVAALVRRMLDGAPLAPGARACVEDVTLAEFEHQFAAFDIKTKTEFRDGANALSHLAWA